MSDHGTVRASDGHYRPGSGAMAASDSPDTIARALPIFLAHASPRFLLGAVTVALLVRLRLGDWSGWDTVPILALLLLWPLQEWAIHVFVLHFKPRRLFGRTVDFRVPRSHREHHSDPWNYRILFIPFHSFLYSVPILVALWYAVTPSPALAWTGILGHLVLALHYEWVHFLVHTRVRPRSAYYKHLWDNHRLHHFKNEHFWFGVTRTEGDRLLGTAPEARSTPTSQSCRDLLAA